MKLEKKDFKQNKYNELVDYANSNNLIIVDKGTYYETEEKEEIEKNLEELKEEKNRELKNSRKIYRQSVFIGGIDLETICNKQNLRDNIILGIHPFNEKDIEIFKNEIRFISNFYDNKKKEIKEITNKTKLAKINLVFKKEEKED